ncbi:MAG: hypothetical protein NTY37_06415 [Methanothrix sp.]|nr:hypothetical protein [Methanothrix sp.]
MSSFCLTDLDYSLRKLKYSEGSLSAEQSFHGTNSAKLSVHDKDRFARIYIDLDDPLPLQDLDQLSMWIRPQSGSGSLQIEIYLDGNEKILSLKKNWAEMEMSYSQWNELDGFDLEYYGYGSLDDIKDKLKGKRIVKIYITIYDETVAFIDYIKIGDEIISFEPLEKEDVKDGPASATPGGLITYTITYGNNEFQTVDLIVKEDYDSRTVFIESYPPPDFGTTNIWTFPHLPPGAHGQITIKMRTIKPAAKASIDGHVSGKGFASTEGMLSTEFESYPVTNNVHILAGEFNFSASTNTRIRPIIGSVLQYGEHGSGDYLAEEQLTYSSASIFAERNILASSSPAFVNFSQNRIPLPMRGEWSAKVRAENDYRDILWSDRYYGALSLNLSYRAQLGKTLSYLETTGHVLGLADRTANWPGGFTDTHLAGNFTLQGKARWRWANKTVSPDKGWLECCPLVPG